MIIQADNPALEVHDLTVSYQNKPVLWAIDFSIPKGSLAGIIGPNGAGKSTLIKAIMGLIDTASGYTKVFDQTIDDNRLKISYVPQRESVDWDFPASVLDIVMMGRYGKLGLFKRPQKADKEAAMEALQDVGMQSYFNRQIAQLSGGQQQRVFLARALAQDADLYLMDEPFAGVDVATEKAIISLLQKMRDNGKTVIVVHHDLQSAQNYFDWIVLLNQRLIASGPIKKVFNSELLQETYGGKLTFLSQLSNLFKKEDLPPRKA